MDFANKVVLVTGASSGIGEATAVQFAECSAQLVLVGRNEGNLLKVAETCKEKSKNEALVIVADVTTEADVKRIYDVTAERFKKLDVLVNNAGAAFNCDILNPDLGCLDKSLNVNLRSIFNLTSVFAPLLIEAKGNIINVSSALSKRLRLGSMPYSVAKAALDHLTRHIALELGPKGVRVNVVNPGVTATNFLKNTGLSEEAIQKKFTEFSNFTPLGRVVSSKEVANMILFLASDLAASTTGASFVVDGGMSLIG